MPEPNPPNFALLLGKRMDAKGGDPGSTPLSPPEGQAELSQNDAMKASASDACFDAVKMGDKAAFRDALSDFVQMCVNDYEDSEPPEAA